MLIAAIVFFIISIYFAKDTKANVSDTSFICANIWFAAYLIGG